MKRKASPWTRGFFLLLVLVPASVLVEGIWFLTVLRPTAPPASADAVVIFTGGPGRLESGAKWTERLGSKNLIVSRDASRYVEGIVRKAADLRGVRVIVDGDARTTDGNARFAAGELRRLGAKDAVLVTSWYHLPRAAFLLRFYLLGSGVRIHSLGAEQAPAAAWTSPLIQVEFLKLWGSLGRVALDQVGIRDWPTPGQ